jgi:HEAT repeat protein
MKRSIFGLFIILCLLCSASLGLAATGQGRLDLDKLLAQLRDYRVSNDAKLALLDRAKTDAAAKEYIAERLPALLESYGGGKDLRENGAWGDAAQLAGELKVAAAVPILCRRIDVATNLLGGGNFTYNFFNRAAVQALIRIGPPAVPAVIKVLDSGSSLQRQEAAHVLAGIGTDGAWRALEEHLQTETDPQVRRRIEAELNQRRR